MISVVAALLISSPILQPVADRVPRLDIEATCRAAAADASEMGGYSGCLTSEQTARAQLGQRWSQFSAASKGRCAEATQIGGSPSYVDVLTCLELANGKLNGAPDAGAAGSSADTTTGATQPAPDARAGSGQPSLTSPR